MHAFLMLLYLLYLWIMHFQEEKNWVKLLPVSLLSTIRGDPGLAKYHTVWATLSRHFLLDAFSLACAIWIVVKCIHQRHSRHLANHLNSLIVEELDLCLQSPPVFPEQPSFQYRFMNTLLLSAKLNARFMEIIIAITIFQKQKSLWLIGLFTIIWQRF